VGLVYNLFPGFQIKLNAGFNYYQSSELVQFPLKAYDPLSSNGTNSLNRRVQASNGTIQSWIIEPQINWDKDIGRGTLTMLLGASFQEQKLERKADLYQDFPSDALLDNLAAAAMINNYEFVNTLYRYAGTYGRINYNWDDRYIINVTSRRDGSSRFGPDKKFGTFTAVGVAWLFTNERFFEENAIFSFGKIRASYGTTGNDQIGDYQYLDTYSTNASPILTSQYQGVTWLSPTKLFNPDYGWEVNKKVEVGLELGFWNDKVLMTICYYRNRSSNQLINYSLPSTTGFSGVLANLPATVQNTGVEFELGISSEKTRPFVWTTQLNVTVPRNKLVEFPNLASSAYADTYVVGEPLTIQKVFVSTGVDPATGLFTFRDMNDDDKISSPHDNTKIVFVGQEFFGGLNNSFSYKGWSLDVFLQFVKQTGYGLLRTASITPGSNKNIPAAILDKTIWRQPGDIAELQRLYLVDTSPQADRARQNYLASDASIVDASFIRLKNVSLSYQLPDRLMGVVKCRLYIQGQNLALFSNYEGDDPENQNYANLAPLKILTVGMNLIF
jgi:TonB-linked SusC/RagA family outer membrane protein